MKMWYIVAAVVLSLIGLFIGVLCCLFGDYITPEKRCVDYVPTDECERGVYEIVIVSLDKKDRPILGTAKASCVKVSGELRYEVRDMELDAQGMVAYIEVSQLPIAQTSVCKVE